MNTVVVVESLFGNTRRVGEAVAAGTAPAADVEVTSVANADSAHLREADLLVIGGPTHVHGMASERSRGGALDIAGKQGLESPDVSGPPLRQWIEELPPGQGRRAAAFDTRIGKPKVLTGSAASRIAHLLRAAGYTVVGEESFIVEGTAGPLRAGELERARAWGRQLVDG